MHSLVNHSLKKTERVIDNLMCHFPEGESKTQKKATKLGAVELAQETKRLWKMEFLI